MPSNIIVNVGDLDLQSNITEALAGSSIGNHSGVDIKIAVVKDIGPGTKYPQGEILGIIPESAYIFICDDDFVYGPTTIELLVKSMRSNPLNAHGYFVRPAGDTAPGYQSTCGNTQLEYPVGYGADGIMVTKRMLMGLRDFAEVAMVAEPSCKWVDDVYVSGYLYRRGISMNLTEPREQRQSIDGTTQSALSSSTKRDRGCDNFKCMKAVRKINYTFDATSPRILKDSYAN